MLAYEMNQAPLPEVYGAPLRLRVENQLGYKMVKWIERIEFVETEKTLGKGEAAKTRMTKISTSFRIFEVTFPQIDACGMITYKVSKQETLNL